jgi:hypothetical protein
LASLILGLELDVMEEDYYFFESFPVVGYVSGTFDDD